MARREFREIVIPGRRSGEKFVGVVDGVLSVEECKEWIAFAESKGFSAASVLEDGKTKNPHRTNDRVLIFDEKRSSELFHRLKPFLPAYFQAENHLIGLNERMSFLRYQLAEHYGKHVDVPYEDIARRRRSFVTVQLYLNDGFEGGTTRFDQEVGFKTISERTHLDVVPKQGSALLFEHELTHQGMPVTAGTKYTVRIDAMYQFPPK